MYICQILRVHGTQILQREPPTIFQDRRGRDCIQIWPEFYLKGNLAPPQWISDYNQSFICLTKAEILTAGRLT